MYKNTSIDNFIAQQYNCYKTQCKGYKWPIKRMANESTKEENSYQTRDKSIGRDPSFQGKQRILILFRNKRRDIPPDPRSGKTFLVYETERSHTHLSIICIFPFQADFLERQDWSVLELTFLLEKDVNMLTQIQARPCLRSRGRKPCSGARDLRERSKAPAQSFESDFSIAHG